MKLFFKRLLLYLCCLFGFIVLVLLCLGFFNKRLITQYKKDLGFNTVLLGDSHIQCGINEQQLSQTISMSQAAEPFMFTYTKLRFMLENHHDIKRVLLGCSYHNLSSYYDKSMFGDSSIGISRRYFSFSPVSMQLQLLWKNKKHGFAYLRDVIETGLYNLSVKDDNYSFTGGYYNPYNNACVNSIAVQKKINSQYYPDSLPAGFSALNIQYLKKIIELCHQKKVQLVILNTPLEPGYESKVPQRFRDKFYALINENKLPLIEFRDLPLIDSSFLTDGSHLSPRGAVQATNYLKNVLEQLK